MSIDTKYSVERSAAVSSQSGSSFVANQDVGSIKPNLVTPYSPNWPGHKTEHKPRNKRCKNKKCQCKTKSNRAYECWVCGDDFPTTKAIKRKYFSKNNPAPEGAKKKRRKKNALARNSQPSSEPKKRRKKNALARNSQPSSEPKKTQNVATCKNEPIDNGDLLFSDIFEDFDATGSSVPSGVAIPPLVGLTRDNSLTPLFNYDDIPIPELESFQNMYDSDGGIDMDTNALFLVDLDSGLCV